MAYGILHPQLMGQPQGLLAPQMPQQTQMPGLAGQGGLLGQLMPEVGGNRFYQAYDGVRNTLSSALLNSVGHKSGQEAVRGAAQGAMVGMQADQVLRGKREEQAKAEQQKNRTIELLTKERPDLVPWIQAGAITPSDAFNQVFAKPKSDGTDDIKEYQYAVQQGFKGTFRDYMTEMKKAGAQNISIGGDGAPGLGKLSTDFGYILNPQTGQPVIDPQTGLPSAAPVPGSPAAMEREAAGRQREAQAGNRTIKSDTIAGAADKARELIGKTTTGSAGRVIGQVLSESDAAELRRQVAVMRSTATIESLNAMRLQSPTGGALGNVTQQENQMLADAAGALDPNASAEQFAAQLDNYERTLMRIVHGPGQGDRVFEERRQKGSGKARLRFNPATGELE